METITMKLNSPITDEQWNIITDAELEHSDEIEFTTPSGKKVMYAKVRHGKWIMLHKTHNVDNDYEKIWRCSECNHVDCHSINVEVPFCWYCGAKMDEVNDE